MDWGMLAQAGLWGIVAASSLLLGALLGVLLRLPQRVVAALMAYGSGVLIAALCFEQIPEALRLGGLAPTLWGLLAGGLCFVAANEWLERQERHQRGREAGGQTHMAGLLIAAGAFLAADGDLGDAAGDDGTEKTGLRQAGRRAIIDRHGRMRRGRARQLAESFAGKLW